MPASADTEPKCGTRAFFNLLKECVAGWDKHSIPRKGAALSYYTAFSLAPLITLVLSLLSLAIKRDVAARGIVEQFSGLVGADGGKVVREILSHAGTMKVLSWGTAVSFALLLVSASAAFGELQDALNDIWEVPPPRRHRWLALVRERLLSFSMVFVLGFFMLTSLLVSATVAAVSRYATGGLPPWALEAANTAISLVVISLLFAAIFRMLPAVMLTWREVLPGAVFSALLFLAGKFLLGLYIARSAFASSYGVAGSFVVLLVWVFYSAQILYVGAEFTRAYAKRTKPMQPKGKS